MPPVQKRIVTESEFFAQHLRRLAFGKTPQYQHYLYAIVSNALKYGAGKYIEHLSASMASITRKPVFPKFMGLVSFG